MKIKFKNYGKSLIDSNKFYKLSIFNIYEDIFYHCWVIDVDGIVAKLPQDIEKIKVNIIERIILKIYYKGVLC